MKKTLVILLLLIGPFTISNLASQENVYFLDGALTIKCNNYIYHKTEWISRKVDFTTYDNDLKLEKQWTIENGPIKSEDVSEKIDSFLLPINIKHKEYTQTKKYRKQIDTIFSFLHGEFFYWEDAKVPFRFATFGEKNEKRAFIVAPIYIENIYNTLKLNPKERATLAVTEELLPKLRAFNYFKSQEIKYIGLSCLYSCKNFADSYPKVETEFVGIIVPISLLKKYVAGNLSEEEFVTQISVYTKNSGPDIKKINLSLK